MERATATTIEITITSAEELRLRGRPLSKGAFVAIRSGSDALPQAATDVDRDGGSYLCWHQKLRVNVPQSARSICVEVYRKEGAAVRAVAAANVPVSDFRWPEDYLHFLSYRLRSSDDGARNGIINFSVRVIGRDGGGGGCVPQFPLSVGSGRKKEDDVPVGYPVPYGH